MVAGTQSGVGKTSLALGLACAFARRGLRVQAFKVGPDYLDPTYLTAASGRTCYNLDGWMSGREYVLDLFARKSADADLAIVEGVMGLFDGSSPTASSGSTAEVAAWLGAPVLLVLNAHGAARSAAAMVKGFAEFEPAVRVAGVVANQCGSDGHRKWLADSLEGARLAPLLGAVPRGAFPELRSRHLGLVTADRDSLTAETLSGLADACARHCDLDAVLALARTAPPVDADAEALRTRAAEVRLGVARDEAFHFYYPDNLEALERAGCELVAFSPAADAALPSGLDALYFGGGYPEAHAERLSANAAMREDVRAFCESGRAAYAECGGLMYLARSLETTDGARLPMAGVLPADSRMLARRQALRYVEVELMSDSLWGARGACLRGHEFHYSEMLGDPAREPGWRAVYEARRPNGEPCGAQGYQRGRTLASYVHLHWAGRPGAAERFAAQCKEAT